MPLRQIPGTEIEYYLISYDEDGRERGEPGGAKLSESVKKAVGDPAGGITDVFFVSHGWKGDVGSAIEQYDKWVGEMGRSRSDMDTARGVRPGFKSLVVGLHWPSLPWGDEKIPDAEDGVLAAEGDDMPSIEDEVEQFAASIADTPTARDALRTIIEASRREEQADESIPPDVMEAYETLYAESGLATGDLGAAPGTDHEPWNPDSIYHESLETAGADTVRRPGMLGFGSKLREAVIGPVRQLSFWKMKDRARKFGESGAHDLLGELQQVAKPGVRFHLMGHSFGCIVASAAVAGPPNKPALSRPVHSLYLVQGALSLWSYCASIDEADGKPGYFRRIVDEHLVEGPIVTTRSSKDTAVGKLYPKGAQVARQVVLGDDDLPKYGGIGSYGIQGLGAVAEDIRMEGANHRYQFERGRVYNVEASDVIKEGGGFSGAHSDIAHPEVAHVFWQAVLTP